MKKIFFLLFIFLSPAGFSQKKITFNFTGDIMTGSDYPSPAYLPPSGFNVFRDTLRFLTNADITMGNLEGVICGRQTHSRKKGKHVYAFRMPPATAAILAEAGFDILNLANNHSRDFGYNGFKQCTNYLAANGINYTGIKNKPLYMHVKGVKLTVLGFSCYSYHNNINNLSKAAAYIRKEAAKTEILIVTFHGGAEGNKAYKVPKKTEYYYSERRGNVYKFARTAVDMGADLVIGHGPHVLRGMELYKKRLIAYSLGNFTGYKLFSVKARKGYSMLLKVTVADTGAFIKGRIIPLILQPRGIPRYDKNLKAVKTIRYLNKNNFPENILPIDKKGRIRGSDN
ncbi:MAG TPA: CapA family protein [Spirochaetota bacterium]|nr:CapA family protein [Spirochaetota bacterium]